MRFADKPLSFLIDDILKSSNQSAPTPHSHSCAHAYHCHSQSDPTCGSFVHHRRCRRTRTVFSDAQMVGLEKRFERQKYLSTSDRIELADMLRLSQLQIKTWYQNRRMKWKKQVLQDGHQKVPTKPKGRPKKNSIPSYADLQRLENEKRMSVSTVSSFCTSDNDYASPSTLCSADEEDFVDIEQ